MGQLRKRTLDDYLPELYCAWTRFATTWGYKACTCDLPPGHKLPHSTPQSREMQELVDMTRTPWYYGAVEFSTE